MRTLCFGLLLNFTITLFIFLLDSSHFIGAVVASPTFSLPEYIGGTRNWCACPSSHTSLAHLLCIGTTGMHTSSTSMSQWLMSYHSSRASWIRDSSFTLYALIRLGFTQEANGMFLRFMLKFSAGTGIKSIYGLHL